MNLYPLLRPLAFALDAETAHRMTIRALKLLPAGRAAPLPASLEVRFAGLHFPSPIGLAASGSGHHYDRIVGKVSESHV